VKTCFAIRSSSFSLKITQIPCELPQIGQIHFKFFTLPIRKSSSSRDSSNGELKFYFCGEIEFQANDRTGKGSKTPRKQDASSSNVDTCICCEHTENLPISAMQIEILPMSFVNVAVFVQNVAASTHKFTEQM